jgi:hypothetical protein
MIRFARIRTSLAALILGGALALPPAQSVAPQAAHAAGGPTPAQASILGYWHNADPNTRDITLIHVTYDAFWHKDRVDVWGKCFPKDCYWGTQDVIFYTAELNAYAIGHVQYYTASHVINIKRVDAHLDVYDFFIPSAWDSRPAYTVHSTLVSGA